MGLSSPQGRGSRAGGLGRKLSQAQAQKYVKLPSEDNAIF
jgi:hypothetical protein